MKITKVLLIGPDISASLAGATKIKISVNEASKEVGTAEIVGNTFDVKKLPGVKAGGIYALVLTPTDGKTDGPSQTVEIKIAKNGTVSQVSGFAGQTASAPASMAKPKAPSVRVNLPPPPGDQPHRDPVQPAHRPAASHSAGAADELRKWLESERAADQARERERAGRVESHFERVHNDNALLQEGMTQIGRNTTQANAHLADLKAGQERLTGKVEEVKTEVAATKTAVNATTAAVIDQGNQNQRHLVILMGIIILVAAIIMTAWITDRTGQGQVLVPVAAPTYTAPMQNQSIQPRPAPEQAAPAAPQSQDHGVWLPRPESADSGHFTAMTSCQQGFGPNTVTYYDNGPTIVHQTDVVVERVPVFIHDRPPCFYRPVPMWRPAPHPRFGFWLNIRG